MVKNLLRSVVVNVPVERAYAIWRNFASYPRFLPDVQKLRVEGRRMVWNVLRDGRHRQWEAEIVELTAPHRIAWHASDGRHHRSVVTLKPLGAERTEVALGAEYESPQGEPDHEGERFDEYLEKFRLFAERGDVLNASISAGDESASAESLL